MPPFKGSQSKDKLRLSLWVPVFDRKAKESGDNYFKIKYLDLPAKECKFIKYLVEQKKVSLSNVVACERKQLDFIDIKDYFCNNGAVYFGNLNKLLERNQEFRNEFPFDIINLDTYGPANLQDDLPKPKNLLTIEKIAQLQNKKEYYLLVTFDITDNLRSFNAIVRDIKKLPLKNFKKFQKELSKLKKDKKDSVKKILCIVVSIIFIGFQHDFDTKLVTYPYTYIGNKMRMLCFAFQFNRFKIKEGVRVTTKRDTIRNKNLEDAIDKILKTKTLN